MKPNHHWVAIALAVAAVAIAAVLIEIFAMTPLCIVVGLVCVFGLGVLVAVLALRNAVLPPPW